MSGKSKNKYDVYLWIKHQVIPSCNNIQQNITCEKLIRNFDKIYKDDTLSRQLMFASINHDQVIKDKKQTKQKKK